MRCNLFMANPAIKRISASIGARASVFGGKFEGERACFGRREGETCPLGAFSGLKTEDGGF
ncbi:hypothetical protein D3C87_1200040 [compost metagenome]